MNRIADGSEVLFPCTGREINLLAERHQIEGSVCDRCNRSAWKMISVDEIPLIFDLRAKRIKPRLGRATAAGAAFRCGGCCAARGRKLHALWESPIRLARWTEHA